MKIKVRVQVYHTTSDSFWESKVENLEQEQFEKWKEKMGKVASSSFTIEDGDGNIHFFNEEVLRNSVVSLIVQ